jgi:4-hydroxysphinganine ceramide fatty acyl 2-hydroxylase
MNNMATTHPKLLLWFASKNPLHVFIKLIPIIAVLFYAISKTFTFTYLHFIHFVIGIVTWSIFEYAVHRWVYHINFKQKNIRWFLEAFHQYHHQYLDKHHVLNAGWLLIYPLFIVFWALYFLCTNNVAATSFFCMGLLAYYFFYENVHYFIHYKKYKSGYMKFIQSYHLHHHYTAGNKNFGNTLSFWDLVFGTYDGGYKKFDVKHASDAHFITTR